MWRSDVDRCSLRTRVRIKGPSHEGRGLPLVDVADVACLSRLYMIYPSTTLIGEKNKMHSGDEQILVD